MDLSTKALQDIGGIFDQKIADAVKPVYERMDKIENQVTGTQAEFSEVKEQVATMQRQRGRQASSSGAPPCKPSYIEIKGFSSFREREAHGVDRASGAALERRSWR